MKVLNASQFFTAVNIFVKMFFQNVWLIKTYSFPFCERVHTVD